EVAAVEHGSWSHVEYLGGLRHRGPESAGSPTDSQNRYRGPDAFSVEWLARISYAARCAAPCRAGRILRTEWLAQSGPPAATSANVGDPLVSRLLGTRPPPGSHSPSRPRRPTSNRLPRVG